MGIYLLAYASLVLGQDTFMIRNKKVYHGGTLPYCITPKLDKAEVMLTAKPCGEHNGQEFYSDSKGRLVNKKTGNCMISRKDKFLRLSSCSPIDDPQEHIYQTMDGALAIFMEGGV